MRKRKLTPLALALALASCQPEAAQPPAEPETQPGALKDLAIHPLPDSIAWVLTAEGSEARLSPQPAIAFEEGRQTREDEISLFVFPQSQHQEILGIGGAITDASSEVFAQLEPAVRQQVIEAYYGEKGLGYNLLRTTIHSCDFSSESYTYIQEGDSALASFTVARDTLRRIPMIRAAMAAARDSLWIYASPWSPPAFMKDNNNMLRGGKLLPQFRAAWARYYVRFVEEYAQLGIPISGLTIQNEPMAVQRWESCIYTAEEERDFLRDHLGPTLERSGLGHLRIIGWDHNRDLMAHRAATILEDSAAAKYLWGIGFHWYETWTGETPNFNSLRVVQESYPDINLVFTEGCNEGFDPERYQDWKLAERYGNSMINDFNAGTVAWTDWNILLDQRGGPNHVGNFCFAPMHADTQSQELILTPSYHYIGHFSKFVLRGARRLSSASSRNSLQSVSFANPDGSIATVVMNATPDSLRYALVVGQRQASMVIPPRAMQTLLY